jgi:hypothetical protein
MRGNAYAIPGLLAATPLAAPARAVDPAPTSTQGAPPEGGAGESSLTEVNKKLTNPVRVP